ncbi:MAG: hypothetical protein KGN16_24515 [Burkholderiales bacterium]|nr:hypothetical protein [Burkholderiales bacterium]
MAFEPHERRILLAAPRVGPTVVERLEAAGVDSFEKLNQIGIDGAIDLICRRLATAAWGNRRTALEQALRGASRTEAGPNLDPA